jgi:isohexenylglutaconyl-CoA hydratase
MTTEHSNPTLPDTETLLLEPREGRLYITLHRPEVKNALNGAMVTELQAVLEAVRESTTVRSIILRGSEGYFCSGGDLAEWAEGEGRQDPAAASRALGELLLSLDRAPQVVVSVVEGGALGGGLGLVCVSDLALALDSAELGLPETSVGLIPAQITPFLVRRIGFAQARRLALTGMRLGGHEAHHLGLLTHLSANRAALDRRLEESLTQIETCAPGATAAAKEWLHAAAPTTLELDSLLDRAAETFARLLRGEEAREGFQAWKEKRAPGWAPPSGR